MTSQTVTCEICYMAFNNHSRTPRIFTRCGHSICETCVNDMILDSKSAARNFVACPKCKTHTTFKLDDHQCINLFPKNQSILSLLKKIEVETDCTHGDSCPKKVCLDSKCSTKTHFCENDFEKDHSSCMKELSIPISKFNDMVKVEPSLNFQSFEWDTLKKTVERKLDDVKKTILQFIDLCQKSVENFAEMTRQPDLELYTKDLKFWNAQYDHKNEKIILKSTRQNEVQQLYYNLEFFISKTLNLNFLRTFNTNVVYMCKNFLDFTNNDILSKSSLKSDISNSSSMMREHFILKDFVFDQNVDSLDQYYLKVQNCFEKSKKGQNNTQIWDLCHSTFEQDTTDFFLKRIRKNWSNDLLQDNFIDKLMNDFKNSQENRNNKIIVCDISKNEFSLLNGRDSDQELYYSRNGMFLRITEEEKAEKKNAGFCSSF